MRFNIPVEPPSNLKPPLVRKIWMEGPTEFDVPVARPLRQGVLVSRNNFLGLYTHGLGKVLWSHEPFGAKGALGLAMGPGDTVLHKPDGSIVTQYDVNTGSIVRSIETLSKCNLVGASVHSFLLDCSSEHFLCAFDWSGREIWRWGYGAFCHVLATPDSYVAVENGTHLHVLDAVSGKDLWQLAVEKSGDKGPSDHSNVLVPGTPSVVQFGNELMTIFGDGRVFKHDLLTGELIKAGQTPFRGAYQVSRKSIFILNHHMCEFREYDHQLMKVVDRQELRKEMQQLFQRHSPFVNSLLVSEHAILWTTMYSMIMGLERHAEHTKTITSWIDVLPGAVMPIGVPPQAAEGYMYYSAISLKPGVRKGLVCYESSVSSEKRQAKKRQRS